MSIVDTYKNKTPMKIGTTSDPSAALVQRPTYVYIFFRKKTINDINGTKDTDITERKIGYIRTAVKPKILHTKNIRTLVTRFEATTFQPSRIHVKLLKPRKTIKNQIVNGIEIATFQPKPTRIDKNRLSHSSFICIVTYMKKYTHTIK